MPARRRRRVALACSTTSGGGRQTTSLTVAAYSCTRARDAPHPLGGDTPATLAVHATAAVRGVCADFEPMAPQPSVEDGPESAPKNERAPAAAPGALSVGQAGRLLRCPGCSGSAAQPMHPFGLAQALPSSRSCGGSLRGGLTLGRPLRRVK